MNATAAPIHFAGSDLRRHRHVCAFFNTPDEECRTMLPFIRDGLRQGERIFHTVSHDLQDELIKRLESAGIDVETARRTGQLKLPTPAETYLRGGRFDQDAMLELIREVLDSSVELGFPSTRLSGHVDWGLAGWPSADDWIEYEIRLNYLVSRYQDPIICTYDSNTLGTAMAMDVLRTHPVAVIGGVLQENPFYLPPDEFLRELDDRRKRKASRYAHSGTHRE